MAHGGGQRGEDIDATIVATIARRAAHHPGRVAFTFLGDGERVTDRLTFGALDRSATVAARALRARGAAGARVLLVHPQGLDFVRAFVATLAAGAVAVPAPWAPAGRSNRARLLAIAADCAPALAVTTPDFEDEARASLAPLPVTTVQALEAEGEGLAGDGLAATADDLALLQYTSGSTGTPKGVIVRHGSIQANQALIQDRFGHSEETVTVGWLPLFHDMGLIGNMLQPLYTGSTCVLMPPSAFLQEPARWLEAIHRFGGTTAGAPNFAYDLCADRVAGERLAALDLSRWTVAYNGSEPVRASTLDRFARAFAPQGFRREALFPCYGMAEATLFVCGVDRTREPSLRRAADGRTLVACGRTGPRHDLLIVDPETGAPRPDGEEGEVWFRGPSVASGYWQRPEESERSFGGRAPGRDGAWLRTGDLGLLDGGELFVTGRIKDLIIVRGRNHHPNDIEATVQAAHPALRPHGGAAFSIESDDRPQVVVVQELRRDALRNPPVEEIGRAARAAVAREHGLQVAALVLLRTGGLPRTSSGKVRRRAAREALLAGTLPVVGESRIGYRAPLASTDPAPAPIDPAPAHGSPAARPLEGARP